MSLAPGTHATHGPLPQIPTGHTGTIKLGVLLYNGFDLLDVMGPMRVLGEELNTLNIEIIFISHSLEPCSSSQQVKVAPHHTLESAPKLDIFFMPGGIGQTFYTENPTFVQLIKNRVEASTWTFTVCTGSGILATTGLIDGYAATTNKSLFEWVAATGPKVKWVKRARWVQDGKFVTASGVSAGIDAALFFVSQLTSVEKAREVATYIEYTWHENADEDPFSDEYPYTARP
ncbi:MAG: intracellular protease/amidase protein [Podila humilis]|nr:MAG: intracellular protease/amidase protein [Podila humilis]